MVPVAGSAYTYAYATLGELIAWIIGWDLVLEYAIGSAAVANGWSNYFVALLQNVLRPRSSTPGCCRRPWDYDVDAQASSLLKTVALASGATVQAWFNLPAVVITASRSRSILVVGITRERGVQRGDGAAQRRHHPDDHRRGGGLRRSAQLASVPAQGEGLGGRRRGGRRGSSSPTSGSTRSRRTPRRPGTPSATWRSASSARCSICTVLYVAVAAVLTGMVPYAEDRREARRSPRRSSGTGLTLAAGLITVGILAGTDQLAAGRQPEPAADPDGDGPRRHAPRATSSRPSTHGSGRPGSRRSWSALVVGAGVGAGAA